MQYYGTSSYYICRMGKKETILNVNDRPSFRLGLMVWLIGVSVAVAVACYFLLGCDFSYSALSQIIGICVFVSFSQAIVMGRWHSHVGVMYKKDPARIFVRVFAAVSLILFPLGLVSLDNDWYDFLEHPFICLGFYLVGLLFMPIPLYIHTLLCNGPDDDLPFWPSVRYLKSFRGGEPIYGHAGESALWAALMSFTDVNFDSIPEETPQDEPLPEYKNMTDDYYGRNGEFKTNDTIRAHMEDMQQMSTEPGFNPEDHGYDFDEINDAKADGFI